MSDGIDGLGRQLAEAIRYGVAAAIDRPVEKITKAQADYGQPNDGEKGTCADCRHFSDNACALVDGKIDPEFRCDHFEARRIKAMVTVIPHNG